MHRAIVDRETALQRGMKTYYTGALCKRGHDSPRYTVNGGCVDCTNRKGTAGPEASNAYVIVCRVCCPQRGLPPNAKETIAVTSIFQGLAGDALARVRVLASIGESLEELARKAQTGEWKPFGNPSVPRALPTRASVPPPPPVADPITGLTRTPDIDGQESFRPDPRG